MFGIFVVCSMDYFSSIFFFFFCFFLVMHDQETPSSCLDLSPRFEKESCFWFCKMARELWTLWIYQRVLFPGRVNTSILSNTALYIKEKKQKTHLPYTKQRPEKDPKLKNCPYKLQHMGCNPPY